jgi:hypothetical protein
VGETSALRFGDFPADLGFSLLRVFVNLLARYSNVRGGAGFCREGVDWAVEKLGMIRPMLVGMGVLAAIFPKVRNSGPRNARNTQNKKVLLEFPISLDG